jgi:hypothetical protein
VVADLSHFVDRSTRAIDVGAPQPGRQHSGLGAFPAPGHDQQPEHQRQGRPGRQQRQ